MPEPAAAPPGPPAAPAASLVRWPRAATVSVFFIHGLLFASWTAHIPQVKDHAGLTVGALGLALLPGWAAGAWCGPA